MRSGIIDRRPGTWRRRGSRVNPALLRGLALIHVPCGTLWWAVGDLPWFAAFFEVATLATAIPLLMALPLLAWGWLWPVEITGEGIARKGPGRFSARDEDIQAVVWVVKPRRFFGLEVGRAFRLGLHLKGGDRVVRGWLSRSDPLEDYAARLLAHRVEVLEERVASDDGLRLPEADLRLTAQGLEAPGEDRVWRWSDLDLVGDRQRLGVIGPDGTELLVVKELAKDAAPLRELLARHWARPGASVEVPARDRDPVPLGPLA